MPISTRPDKRYPIYLQVDMDIPVGQRPVFYALTKDMDQAEEIEQEYQDILASCETTKDLNMAICKMLHKWIVAWDNMPGFSFPSSPEEWRSTKPLTQNEGLEILRSVVSNKNLTPEEKKS